MRSGRRVRTNYKIMLETNAENTSKTCLDHVQNISKTYLKHVQNILKHVKTCLKHCQHTSITCPKHSQYMSKTFPKRPQQMSKTCPKHIKNMLDTHLKHVYDISKTCLTYVPNIPRSLHVCSDPNLLHKNIEHLYSASDSTRFCTKTWIMLRTKNFYRFCFHIQGVFAHKLEKTLILLSDREFVCIKTWKTLILLRNQYLFCARRQNI